MLSCKRYPKLQQAEINLRVAALTFAEAISKRSSDARDSSFRKINQKLMAAARRYAKVHDNITEARRRFVHGDNA